MPPGIRDNDDRMVALLEQIAQNTGSLDGGIDREISIEGTHSGDRVGHLQPDTLIVAETDDLDRDDINDDGTITVEPGEEMPLARIRPDVPFAILAVGAVDEVDVTYQLKIDNDPAISPTNSPLGLINDPFSFVVAYGAAIPAEKSAVYTARLDPQASGSVDLAARIHGEVLR